MDTADRRVFHFTHNSDGAKNDTESPTDPVGFIVSYACPASAVKSVGNADVEDRKHVAYDN